MMCQRAGKYKRERGGYIYIRSDGRGFLDYIRSNLYK